MAQFKIIVIVIIACLMSISLYLAWQNRASEKIIASFLTVLLIGSAGTLASTLFTIKDDIRKTSFKRSYIFNKIDKYLLDDIHKPFMYYSAGQERRVEIAILVSYAIEKDHDMKGLIDEKGDHKTLDKGRQLYSYILFAEIIDTLFGNCNWRAKVKRTSGLGWSSMTYSKTPKEINTDSITLKKIKDSYPDNYLLNTDIFKNELFSVPLGTKLEVGEGKISLKTSFVNLDIFYKQSGGSIGAGKLSSLIELRTSEILKYWTQDYEIELNAKFNPIKSGHPEMEYYQNWIDQIFSEFKHYFDSEDHWEKIKEAYHFYKDIPIETKDQTIEEQKIYKAWMEKQKIEQPTK